MNYNILEVKEMPFTMKGYPEKWKDFEVIKRQKAIEPKWWRSTKRTAYGWSTSKSCGII